MTCLSVRKSLDGMTDQQHNVSRARQQGVPLSRLPDGLSDREVRSVGVCLAVLVEPRKRTTLDGTHPAQRGASCDMRFQRDLSIPWDEAMAATRKRSLSRVQDNRKKGLCVGCSLPVDGKTARCAKCRQSAAQSALRNQERRRSHGICSACLQPATVGRCCLDHWFCKMAEYCTGSRKNSHVLRSLWEEQSGQCAYTDEKLVPGENASVDHKTPRARGGDGSKGNLQWVTERVNRMKTDMTHDEFFAMCQLVLRRRS